MISVIIPSYNSEYTISKCLDSIGQQTYAGDFEIIVVDSSSDRTPEIVASCYPAVKLVHLRKRTDPGSSRNIGIGEIRGELIAFIDADCVAAPDWLERMAAAHESSYDIVGGIVRNSPESRNLAGRAGYMAEFRDFLPGQERQEVPHIPTCNISYKRRIFREFGMFQGQYYPQEDLFFNYGLWKRGEKMLLDPSIQVWHQHRTRLGDFLCHQHSIGRATARVLREIPLEGSWIAERPLLATCVAPFMVMVKLARTLRSFSEYEPSFIREGSMVVPVLALGLACWAIGFVGSAYSKKAKSFGTK
jgi:glycosyltransferase involved in cell wall biosynthesis